MVKRLAFAVPGDLAIPTGGYAYDRRMVAELIRLGWRVDDLDIGNDFPRPSARTRAAAPGTLLSVQPGAAQTAMQSKVEIPAAIAASELTAYLTVPAKGVQIYTCAKNPAGAWAWAFKGPEAELFDTQQKTIGKHYGGPTWEGSDGGKVVGGVKANVPAPTGNDIPWLLLDIKSSEGSGQFTQAKAIQRIQTMGGTAPPQGCDEANANKESRVPYTATYLFLK